jgi:hypothetical protein
MNQEFEQLFTNLAQKSNNKVFYSTIISNTFLYISGNVNQCDRCQNKKTEYNNSFLFEFYLDIIYNKYIGTEFIKEKNDEKYTLTLELCFKHFNELYDQDLVNCFCDRCKKETKHKINNYLFNLPNILIISVNKESDSNNEYVFSFPEELNLKKFVNNQSKIINYKYKLIGAISHQENKKKYNAFCKHNISNKWYKCNDLKIDICSNPIKEILNQNVDVLIYESFSGSTGSINIKNIIDEKNINSNSSNNSSSMNNDDDNRETNLYLKGKTKSGL